MNINTQIVFSNIYSKFCSETHSPADIGTLIELIRYHKQEISDDAKTTLLQIPLCALKNQLDVPDEYSWAIKNGDYFAGNYSDEPLHSQFDSKKFDLSIMVDCLEAILADTKKLNSDFCLRNPEVTLTHDVVVKEYSNFKESGKIYALVMEKAFNL